MEIIPENLHLGGYRILQKEGLFKLSTDSVLLSGWLRPPRGARAAVDFGCGTGVLELLICARYENISVDGIELNPEAAALARENVALNGILNRVRIFDGDIREVRPRFEAGAFDFAVSNPPYRKPGSGKDARGALLSARAGIYCGPDELCAAAAYALRFGGSFFVCYPPERLCDLFFEMRRSGLEPKRMRLAHYDAGAKPFLALCEARRGGSSGLAVEKPLFVMGPDGKETADYLELYGR